MLWISIGDLSYLYKTCIKPLYLRGWLKFLEEIFYCKTEILGYTLNQNYRLI